MKKVKNNYIKPEILAVRIETFRMIATSNHEEQLGDNPQNDIVVGSRKGRPVYDDFEDDFDEYDE